MLQHTQVHGDELISDSDDGGLAGAVQVRASPWKQQKKAR